MLIVENLEDKFSDSMGAPRGRSGGGLESESKALSNHICPWNNVKGNQGRWSELKLWGLVHIWKAIVFH